MDSHDNGYLSIRLSFRAPDATGREPGLLLIHQEKAISVMRVLCMEDTAIQNLFQSMIASAENHEMNEWLLLDGQYRGSDQLGLLPSFLFDWTI